MFEVELVDTEQGFLALEDEWRSLFCQCQDVPYFMSWEFASARWRYFADGRELWVLVARNHNGNLIGIAPWAIAIRSSGPFQVRRLEFLFRAEHPAFLSPYDGENVDVLARPEHQDAVTAAFVHHLCDRRNQWDIADFALLSSDSELRTLLKKAGVRVKERPSARLVSVLPHDWSTYEQTVLGTSKARQIRKYMRRLERDFPGRVRFEHVKNRDEVESSMDHLIEMNVRRFTEIGQSTVFDDERYVQFHRDFALAAFDSGWLRFYQLRVGESVIAINWGVALKGVYYGNQKGFDPDWKKYAPGHLLQAHEYRQVIEEGFQLFDEGHGASETKAVWINSECEDVHLVASSNWKGTLYLGQLVGFSMARDIGRHVVPESAKPFLKQVISRGE